MTTTTNTATTGNRPVRQAPDVVPVVGLRQRLTGRVTLTAVITWAAAACFIVVILGVLGGVVLQSFATVWRGGWAPAGYTTGWYSRTWNDTGIPHAILVTFESGFLVVAIALLAGVPAGYVLARRNFPGKSLIMLLMLLPIALPQMTYAVQLAALMYRLGLGGTLAAVVLVNLVPALPLVVLIMIPFVEQISPDVENAGKVLGANNLRLFTRVLVPLLLPGVLAAGIFCLVRVLGSFELTFFVASADTQTLVVALFAAMADPGGTSYSLTAAMAVYYMLVAVIGLAIGLRFTNPVQALNSRH